MKRIIAVGIVMFLMQSVHAQVDKKNVEKLCGCFDVEFKYAETFSPDKAYKYHNREEISAGLELIVPVEVGDNKVVMQHLLVISDEMIIKHWREDWSFEDPILWRYKGGKVWVKEQLPAAQVAGKWTQSVWEVSDAPRYQGTSQWVNIDGKTFWQNTVDAPLPRREYTTRNDYNILRRTNRIVLTNDGWIHEQDNQKIIRQDGTDKLLVEEKGINSYKRVDDSKCAAAKLWWEKNKEYWTSVRKVWNDYVTTHSVVSLKDMVDGKVLHQLLDDIATQYAAKKIQSSELEGKIKAALEKYIDNNKALANK
jgi:hypothetical protein